LSQFVAHYHEESNHQGTDNVLLFPSREQPHGDGTPCKERLDGGRKRSFRVATPSDSSGPRAANLGHSLCPRDEGS
jgi:hypothetical protein